MDYELAKKLKDAGFPQKLDVFDKALDSIGQCKGTYLPTLSELIEACGDGYFDLYKNGGSDLLVVKCPHKTKRLLISGSGSTPEEAVANLWLELNKNGIN